ncbi:hypothetical protein [Streptomyces sp. NPDC059862]|uniref:hypothetical protein n=1 Tax=unclassified Streptomyces TaxID=2593676 RepID=UPI003630A6C1
MGQWLCPEGGRGAFVVITEAGREVIAEAAPRHANAVRRLFIDPLAPGELSTLACLADRIVEQLEKQA